MGRDWKEPGLCVGWSARCPAALSLYRFLQRICGPEFRRCDKDSWGFSAPAVLNRWLIQPSIMLCNALPKSFPIRSFLFGARRTVWPVGEHRFPPRLYRCSFEVRQFYCLPFDLRETGKRFFCWRRQRLCIRRWCRLLPVFLGRRFGLAAICCEKWVHFLEASTLIFEGQTTIRARLVFVTCSL